MGCYEIDHAVNDIVRIFLEEGYTEKTITEHRRNIQRVVNLHYEHETPFYDSKIVEHYIAGLEENYKLGIISRSRKNGVDLSLISQWLGHSCVETTLIYAHADTEIKRQAIEKAVPEDSELRHFLNAERYTLSDEELLKQLCGLK